MTDKNISNKGKDPAYWTRVNEWFDVVLSLPEKDRPAKLLEIGSTHPDLIDDLCQLVGSYERAPDFLERPAAKLNPTAIPSLMEPGRQRPALLAAGSIIGDFEIEALVGEGSFAHVYKAVQRSLQRTVAVKVTSAHGREARNMAGLDHDHIVRVFLETKYPERNLYVICMQYVEGVTLGSLIRHMRSLPENERNGATIIEFIDANVRGNTAFDAAAQKDRSLIASMSFEEASLWIGARLAEALDFAHSKGILHLDVKPANILINQYGRPLLTDFNVALNLGDVGEKLILLGGTIDYMSPEQEKAFTLAQTGGFETTREVGQESDIYSLGIVVLELLLCNRPRVAAKHADGDHTYGLLPEELCSVLTKATAKTASERFASGRDFAHALENCGKILAIRKKALKDEKWVGVFERFPVAALVLAAVVPQILGSIINISYNSLRIAVDLTGTQQDVFLQTIFPYNVVSYPFGVLIVAKQALFIIRNIKKQQKQPTPDPIQMAALRKRGLATPLYLFAACSIGWLPGVLIFPLVIDWQAGPIVRQVYWHFGISFVTSWLVALTYSYFLLELLVIKMLYTKFWTGCCDITTSATRELAPVLARMKLFQLLAGAIPLLGALMIVTTSSSVMSPEKYRIFQLLIIALISMAICGFVFAIKISEKIASVISLYTRD